MRFTPLSRRARISNSPRLPCCTSIPIWAWPKAARTQVKRAGIFQRFEDVPHYGLSLTMYALLRPGRVLALVHDADKAPVIKQLLEGPVTFMCPASLLQTAPHATLYLNQPAAAQLTAFGAK